MIQSILKSMRIQQWVKNLFLFAAIIFARHIHIQEEFIRVVEGFFCFSFIASGIYILNDIVDAEQDKLHPQKKFRPIPAGLLSKQTAFVVAVLLFLTGLFFSFLLNNDFGAICSGYFVLNLAYSFRLKYVVILDVMSIAIGFVLRVLAGAVLINVPATEWLLMCTFLLSLFLGFVKRRNEITTLNESAESHRAVLENYSVAFLDQMVSIVTACTVMSYALYTISEETIRKFHTTRLIFTVPFVLFGIFRYLFLVHKEGNGGNPTQLVLTDIPLIVNIIGWIGSVIYIIYL